MKTVIFSISMLVFGGVLQLKQVKWAQRSWFGILKDKLCLGRQNFCTGKYGKVIAVYTPRKTNMDNQNDGLENVTPFANMAYFWYSIYLEISWGKKSRQLVWIQPKLSLELLDVSVRTPPNWQPSKSLKIGGYQNCGNAQVGMPSCQRVRSMWPWAIKKWFRSCFRITEAQKKTGEASFSHLFFLCCMGFFEGRLCSNTQRLIILVTYNL